MVFPFGLCWYCPSVVTSISQPKTEHFHVTLTVFGLHYHPPVPCWSQIQKADGDIHGIPNINQSASMSSS